MHFPKMKLGVIKCRIHGENFVNSLRKEVNGGWRGERGAIQKGATTRAFEAT